MPYIRCGLENTPEVNPSQNNISFKDFQHLPDQSVAVGMRIGPLDPSKLYVSQSWTDAEKLGIALAAYSPKDILVIPLYTHRLRFADGTTHRTVVIGDCHHRTLVWAVNGSKIEGEIVGTSLPKHWRNSNIIPFSRFRRLHETEILRI